MSGRPITDAMVEAAARTHYETTGQDCCRIAWHRLGELRKDDERGYVRPILEAAEAAR